MVTSCGTDGVVLLGYIRVRGGKRSAPNGVYDSCVRACVMGEAGDAVWAQLSKRLFFFFFLPPPPLFPVSRVKRDLLEVGISGHGADRCDQDDEIYIVVQEIWSSRDHETGGRTTTTTKNLLLSQARLVSWPPPKAHAHVGII